MTITASEQYMLELINRARLDPVGEAARYGITLNQGLTANQLGTQVRQVLAGNPLLETAATGHSQWMLSQNIFSHTGAGGSTPGMRAAAAGYAWTHVGENLSWQGTTGSLVLNAALIDAQHKGLFLSPGHRVNILYDVFREIGISQEAGLFKQGTTSFNTSMITELFGTTGSKVFVTGVTYNDTNKDSFYSIGEGTTGVSFSAGGASTSSAEAGGYALAVTPGAAVLVTGRVGVTDFSATLDMTAGNVKLDVVNGNTLFTSGNITLGSGLNDVRLLGAGALKAVGNDLANKITGNSAANTLDGREGHDLLSGMAGNDTLLGGGGNDTLVGDLGADSLQGGAGADLLQGGAGTDWMEGGAGNDTMTGGLDRDTFVFMDGSGQDTITDFSVGTKEVLLLDDALWGNAVLTEAQVVQTYAKVVNGVVDFNFGDDVLHLTGVRGVTGLAALIDFI